MNRLRRSAVRWMVPGAVATALAACATDNGGSGTGSGASSSKPHCDELQALGDKCCGQGFKAACGSVSKDFTEARCNESLDKLKNKCSNFECKWSDDACFQ
jgi:hypothetical protein